MTLVERLRSAAVVPVLRSPTAEDAVATARGLAAGGLDVVELTFSTPGVLDALAELRGSAGLTVGIGTVLTERQAHDAVDAGAAFLVSPVWRPWLVELGAARGVEVVPGAATPTEVLDAHEKGAAAVKLFPIARLGGASYIRDLIAPMPGLRLMATGGVDAAAARELLAAGCVAVGVGRPVLAGDEALQPEEQARRFRAAVLA